MPRVIDSCYATPLEMHDPDQPAGRGALLIAPLGRGMYIDTTPANKSGKPFPGGRCHI